MHNFILQNDSSALMMSCSGLLVFLLVPFSILNISFAQHVINSCVCGETNVPITRIVNGVRVIPNKYPWMAAMLSSRKQFMCGGAIISDRNIITAGHCLFYTSDPLKTEWVLGMHSKKLLDGVKYHTFDYLLHPNFANNSIYDDYDISIVTVERNIVFNQIIRPICLPNLSNDFAGKVVTVAGWGKLNEKTMATTDELMETKVLHKTNEECMRMTEPLIKFNVDSMICAFAKGTDACQGDSGGPLFIEADYSRHVVLGVVSFGDGCARPFPGIYGKLTTPQTLDWITESMIQSSASVCSDPPVRRRRNSRRHFVPLWPVSRPLSYRVLPFATLPRNYYIG